MNEPTVEHPVLGQYEVRVKGHLDLGWAEWLEVPYLIHESGGTTVLRGPVADQAALHGLLAKVRDMGVTLISVHAVEDREL